MEMYVVRAKWNLEGKYATSDCFNSFSRSLVDVDQ